MSTRGSHHPVWIFSLYSDDKNIYGTHVTIYLEREKIKILSLVSPMGKRGCLSTIMVHLGLVGMRVVFPSFMTPLVDLWPFILLGPRLLLCVPLA